MKKTFSIISHLVVLTVFVSSCDNFKKSYFVQVKPSDTNPQVLETAVSILNKRLETAYDGDAVARVKGDVIELELHKKVDLKELSFLVITKGNFTLHETFSKHEMLQRIIPIDSNVQNIGFLSVVKYGIGASGDTPILGDAGRYDTADVMASSTMQALKRYSDVEFVWGREGDAVIPLYMLKRDKLVFSNRSIESSSLSHDAAGRESVSITLKKEFHQAWLEMTQKNLNRPIAIRLDDRVLSAPIVNGAIPNGRLEISGGLDRDARTLAALLTAEQLPTSLSIVAIDPALEPGKRSYPTTEQLKKYNDIREGFMKHRHGIDSILNQHTMNPQLRVIRHHVRQVFYRDLTATVDETKFTQEQVDQYLANTASLLEQFKTLLDPNAPSVTQSFFDSLAGASDHGLIP